MVVQRESLGRQLKRLDFFQTNVQFRENGDEAFGSIFGACLSLIISLVVGLYGINKFIIMSNHDDTQFNEYSVIQGLSQEVIDQDELQFQIAISAFNWELDIEGNHVFENDDHDQYIQYFMSVWNLNETNYTLEEIIYTHRCNETDKDLFSKN